MPDSPQVRLTNPTPGKCRQCGTDVPHPRQYCDEHRPAQRKRKLKAQQAQGRASQNLATPVHIPTDIAGAARPPEGGKGRGRGKPVKAPTVDATAKVLGRTFMYVTLLIAARLVTKDPAFSGVDEHTREEQVHRIAMDEAQATNAIHPLARFLTPLGVWQAYGGHVIENADIIDCIVALYDYFSGLAQYAAAVRSRRLEAANANANAIPARSWPVPSPQPVQETNGHIVEPVGMEDERQGRVLSYKDLHPGDN